MFSLCILSPKEREGRESLDLVRGLISEVPYAVLFGLIRINTLSKEQGCHWIENHVTGFKEYGKMYEIVFMEN